MHHKLFTPGPTEVRSELLQELSTPQIHHRSEEFSELYSDIQTHLKELLFTDNPVFIFPSSSTGAMEAAVTNGVGKNCLNLINGAFGKRWHEITKSNGVPCEKFALPWGEALKPEMVDEQLSKGNYDAVTLVFNETSTGMMNPVQEIGEVVDDYPDVMFLVDAVSGMAGAEIRVDDWNIDMCLAGVQKAFALPAGLAVASVSDRLLDRASEVPQRSYYFNLPLLHKYHKRQQTRTTPPVPHLFALKEQLREIVEEEGIEGRFNRHEEMAEVVQDWALEYFDIYPEEGYWSKTLTCIDNTVGISVKDLNSELMETYNVRISNGYGDISEKTFRIAHMGDTSLVEIRGLLEVINEILDLRG